MNDFWVILRATEEERGSHKFVGKSVSVDFQKGNGMVAAEEDVLSSRDQFMEDKDGIQQWFLIIKFTISRHFPSSKASDETSSWSKILHASPA